MTRSRLCPRVAGRLVPSSDVGGVVCVPDRSCAAVRRRLLYHVVPDQPFQLRGVTPFSELLSQRIDGRCNHYGLHPASPHYVPW